MSDEEKPSVCKHAGEEASPYGSVVIAILPEARLSTLPEGEGLKLEMNVCRRCLLRFFAVAQDVEGTT